MTTRAFSKAILIQRILSTAEFQGMSSLVSATATWK
jgi:hypothetical protein